MKQFFFIACIVFFYTAVFITNAVLIYKGADGWGWFLFFSFVFLCLCKFEFKTSKSTSSERSE